MKSIRSLFVTIIFVLLIPLLLLAIKKVIDLRKSAASVPANIVVDIQNSSGPVPSMLWQNLSQGGEEPVDMIKPVISQVKALHPQLIRIDHLFDYYRIDQGNGNFDFSRLDGAIDSIKATGAVPMLSISYTPDAKEPSDWSSWQKMVTTLAHRYSVEKNIPGIYYEVWNEPDLFGGWHYDKSPNYSNLYVQTAQAVASGAGSANYKIGGPAITAYYSNWIKSLFKTAAENHVRLDFISWHKYSKNMADYDADFENLNSILSDYPQFFNIERLITEVGPNSDPDTAYDNSLSGVHLISLVTHLSGKIHRVFTFEPIDGPSPRSDKSTGWGLITHDGQLKPRYYAIAFLNQIQGHRLASTGDGTFVTSFSAKYGHTIQTLLVNYDPDAVHAETFPVTYQNLPAGKYQIKTINYLGGTSIKVVTANGSIKLPFYLDPNSAELIELTPIN